MDRLDQEDQVLLDPDVPHFHPLSVSAFQQSNSHTDFTSHQLMVVPRHRLTTVGRRAFAVLQHGLELSAG